MLVMSCSNDLLVRATSLESSVFMRTSAVMIGVYLGFEVEILFSFLSVGWGFISDIDIESERLRVIGGQRFTVWSVARLIGKLIELQEILKNYSVNS
ncbi:hypothetical protein PR048_021600 [Dryococelus australis]|uniref:Transmembrane protein n=1 Tax=Dryococelus australis TaxID=614101 RepID=A0ABQ9GYS3_9NEOP|nr:hypothetical protein PR048_021600 [Dryococelus australis]